MPAVCDDVRGKREYAAVHGLWTCGWSVSVYRTDTGCNADKAHSVKIGTERRFDYRQRRA